jgi:DNA polymerase-3 subunit delta
MILFFYGEDSFRINTQIKKIKDKYISASLGDTNLAVIDMENTDYLQISRQVLSMPFLAKTRLVIIENILSEGRKDIQDKISDLLPKVPKTTVLVFSDTKPDKRLTLYKKLLKSDKVQEFKLLDDIQIKRWVKKEVDTRGGDIEPDAINKLIEYTGNDLWRLTQEIEKLTNYNKQLTTKNIELLVHSQTTSDVFKMIDAIARKNLKSALYEYQRLIDNGEHDLYVLTMIVYQYRNLLVLKDMQMRTKLNSSWDLAKRSGINPYVVQKIMPILQQFELNDLKKDYKTLLDFDVAIKTGKMESRIAITLLLNKLIR